MAQEIERKFLVIKDKLQLPPAGKLMTQAYLSNEKHKSIRIRIADLQAFLTIKSGTNTLVRKEFEYEIPLKDAHDMLEICEPNAISKHRYLIPQGKHTWEVDVFHNENEGLIVAEIELEDENETFDRPEWLGEEVTNDPRYLNASLVRFPFSVW